MGECSCTASSSDLKKPHSPIAAGGGGAGDAVPGGPEGPNVPALGGAESRPCKSSPRRTAPRGPAPARQRRLRGTAGPAPPIPVPAEGAPVRLRSLSAPCRDGGPAAARSPFRGSGRGAPGAAGGAHRAWGGEAALQPRTGRGTERGRGVPALHGGAPWAQRSADVGMSGAAPHRVPCHKPAPREPQQRCRRRGRAGAALQSPAVENAAFQRGMPGRAGCFRSARVRHRAARPAVPRVCAAPIALGSPAVRPGTAAHGAEGGRLLPAARFSLEGLSTAAGGGFATPG